MGEPICDCPTCTLARQLGNGAARRMTAPSFGQVAQLTLASSELFRTLRTLSHDDLIQWYQQEYARHPARLALLEALIGVRGAM